MLEQRVEFDPYRATRAPGTRVVAAYAHTLWDAARAEGLCARQLAQALVRPTTPLACGTGRCN